MGRDTYNDGQIVVRNMTKNGFVQVDWWGNAERHEFMRAYYWKRANGNRLLGIYFGGTDNYPNIHFLCFYNYDTKKHTLTPEPQIIEGYRTTEDTKFYYDLPEEGKEFKISEFGPQGYFIHTFKWDGMKPVFSKTETEIVILNVDINIMQNAVSQNCEPGPPVILDPEENGDLSNRNSIWDLWEDEKE